LIIAIIGSLVIVGVVLGVLFGFVLGKEGQLPTLSTGNQWVYDFSMNEGNYTYNGTLTQTVTGQEMIGDTDCYTLNWTFDPAMMWMTTFTVWVGKDTLMEKKMDMSGPCMNLTWGSVTNMSYEFDKAPWPLEVGKEVAMTINETTTVYMNDTVISTTTEITNGTLKVEGKEKITVAAEEFDCFKVVRNETGHTIQEAWYADQVKGYVKSRSYEDTVVVMSEELESYSV
jgi:hypothetical protein